MRFWFASEILNILGFCYEQAMMSNLCDWVTVNSWLIGAATNNADNTLKKKKIANVGKNRPNNLISKIVTREIYDFHYIYS